MRPPHAALACCLLLLASPPVASLPPPQPSDTILAIADIGDATLPALQAAGYPPCSTAQPSFCYDAYTSLQFATANLAAYTTIFVGTHEGTSNVYAALVARSADIKVFVNNGGSLIALGEPTTGNYEFVPNDNPWPIYMFDEGPADIAEYTQYGYGHPALVGVTNASMTGWAPSWDRYIYETPNYLGNLVEGRLGGSNHSQGPIALAGNYGSGCVLITTLTADETAIGLHAPTRTQDAADLIHAIVDWSLHCAPVPDIPIPYTGTIRIVAGGPTNGPAPTATIGPGLSCGPLTQIGTDYQVECYPSTSAPQGFVYVCVGSALANSHYGRNDQSGRVSCGGTALASCSTGYVGTPPATWGACWQFAGAQYAEFPLRCTARPGIALASSWSWQTICGSSDP